MEDIYENGSAPLARPSSSLLPSSLLPRITRILARRRQNHCRHQDHRIVAAATESSPAQRNSLCHHWTCTASSPGALLLPLGIGFFPRLITIQALANLGTLPICLPAHLLGALSPFTSLLTRADISLGAIWFW